MTPRIRRVLVWLPLVVMVAEFSVYAVLTSSAARAGVTQARNDLPIGAVIMVASVVMSATGCFIVARRPGNVIGRLYALIPIGFWMKGMSDGVVYASLVPGAEPAAWAAWLSAWVYVPAVGMLGTFVLLLYPDGRLPSRRWRAVVVLAIAAMTLTIVGSALAPGPLESFPIINNPYAAPAWLAPVVEVVQVALVLLPLSFLASALSLVFRARAGSPVLREQVKWIAFVGALLAVGFGLAVTRGFDLLGAVLVFVPICALPVASAVAILRYRLFEIDRIISRTVSYALLTALIIGVYGVVVLVPMSLIDRKRTPDMLVAIGTLAAALVARPALRRIRNAVDHRFDRHRYDAERTIGSFNARLRDEVDIDTLRDELIGTVDRALRPASASVWLRQPA